MMNAKLWAGRVLMPVSLLIAFLIAPRVVWDGIRNHRMVQRVWEWPW